MKLIHVVLKHLRTMAIPWMPLNLCFVVKPQDVVRIDKLLNGFDKNLTFTVDLFENEVSHFIDLEMSPDRILIYWKDTNTGLYMNNTSFAP